MATKKITVPFVDCNSRIPMIRVKIGDVWTNAIIDTGAGSTLIGSDVLKLPEATVIDDNLVANFTGIGEYRNKKIAQINVNAGIAGFEVTISGYEFDLSSIIDHFVKICGYDEPISFILGSGFLNSHDAVIDYENRLVTLSI